MALQRDSRYPGRWLAPSGGHPQGAWKNRSAPGALDGSYIEADWANDWDGYMSSLLNAIGVAANGTVDAVGASQYYNAMLTIAQRANMSFAVDTGVANAYVCAFTPAITVRSESAPIRFKVKTTNTTACTINDGIGVVPLVGGAHAGLQGNELIANGDAWASWNANVGTGSYVLLFCTGAPEQVAPATQSQHAVQLSQMAAQVGGIRNGTMSVTGASATATFTADEVAVKSALGGVSWLLSSFNKTINLAATGVGGMDTGAVPASGFVALYAIYNPATGTSALLAVNATSAKAPEVYGGANMPAGYTASALVSVRRVASSLFVSGYQIDRVIFTPLTTVLNTSTQQNPAIALNISTYAPLNAKSCHGTLTITSSASASNLQASIDGASTSMGTATLAISNTGVGSGIVAPFPEVPIITPQTLYYLDTASTGTISFIVALSEYTF